MKLKYYFPTSFTHLWGSIIRYALFTGLVIALMTVPSHAADLTITGGTATLYGNQTYDNIYIINGAVVTIATYNGTTGTGYLNFTATGNFFLDSTSSIVGTAKGLTGGAAGGIGAYGGTGTASAFGTAGIGGEGVSGTHSGANIGGAGATYGANISNGFRLGNGAGGGGGGNPRSCYGDPGTVGGNGGGALSVVASNIVINGTITMNGGAGGNGGYSACYQGGAGGGGSNGGSIWLSGTTHLNIENSNLYTTYGSGGGGSGSGGNGYIGSSGGIALFFGTGDSISLIADSLSTSTKTYSSIYTTNYIPSTPSITYPTQSGISESITINATWGAITDPYGAVTYNVQFSNVSDFSANVTQFNTTNINQSATLSSGINYVRVRANNTYEYSEFSPTITFFLGGSTLYTPANNSVFYIMFPTLTDEISFTWSLPSGYASELQIANDIDFNLLVFDQVTPGGSYKVPLGGGVYKWRVRFYHIATSTYYAWGTPFNFSVISTSPVVKTPAIHGVVYEIIGATQTPISGATVYFYNNTISRSMVTGSNGYYLFDELENSTTYNIYVSKKDYDSSPTMPVTTGIGTLTEKNIAIERTQPLFFDADKHYVLLKARWLYCIFSCDITGATISVYKSGEVIPYATDITDSTGSVSFLLYKTQHYRITIVKASEGVNKEETLYPKDNSYIFLITNSPISWRNHTIEQKDALAIAVTRNIINSTHTYINVSYQDSLAQTTALNIGITNNNISVATWSGSGNTSQSFVVSNYSGNSYLVKLTGTHTTYGSLSETYSVFFEKSAVGITGIPEALWLWFWIAIMFFTAAVFTSSTAELGLIIVCAEGWIGLTIGAFSSINTTQFGIGLTLVSILGVLAYIKKQQAKEGM